MEMKRNWRANSQELLGIDIGEGCVKAVLLKEKRGNIYLHNFAIYPIRKTQKPADQGGETMSIKDALQKICEDFPKHINQVAIAVEGQAATSKFIVTPTNLRGMERELHIEHSVENLTPFPLQDIFYDYESAPVKSADPNVVEYIVSIVTRAAVNNRVSLFDDIDMTVAVVDIQPYALTNGFSLLFPEKMHFCCIDIGIKQYQICARSAQGQIYTACEMLQYSAAHDDGLMLQDIIQSLQKFKQKHQIELAKLYLCGGGSLSLDDELLGKELGEVPIQKITFADALGIKVSEGVPDILTSLPLLVQAIGLASRGLHLCHR